MYRSGWLAIVLAVVAGAWPEPGAADAAVPGLVVIGATAKSSTEIISQALSAGLTVTGIARHPEDVTLRNPHLKILKGDVYDVATLEAAMTGQEVVVSMISPRIDPTSTAETPATFDLFTTGTANIIAAMKNDSLSTQPHRRQHFNHKPARPARRRQHCAISRATAPVVIVVAHDDRVHCEYFVQRADKFVTIHGLQRL